MRSKVTGKKKKKARSTKKKFLEFYYSNMMRSSCQSNDYTRNIEVPKNKDIRIIAMNIFYSEGTGKLRYNDRKVTEPNMLAQN